MDHPFLEFHHLGLAVKHSRRATALLAALGYQIGDAVFDPTQNVHLALCTHECQPAVEVIWPSGDPGPIDVLTERHSSGVIYHICYQTNDLTAALAKLQEAGLRVICLSPPSPAPLFNGKRVSFYNVAGMGLVEILE